MECVFGFASSVSRDLVCGALNQLRYPCCFKNFVKRLEEEESNLIITKDSVQKFVTHNQKQARKPSEIVDKWLEDAINDVHNVNQLLEKARTQKHCCFGHCPNWIWRYHLGKKLANKTMHLEKVIEEGRKYVPFDRIATLPSNTLHMLSEKCMNFESRQSAYEQLLDAVKNKDVSMIGLYGMGGCGKTTLAMEVRKLVEAEHLFEKVLFVPVSSTVEVRRIQEKIASSLQFEFPETEEMQRAQRLCSRLTQEKNIFIILDDVWEKLDFGRIGIPSSEHLKGCKILITSRSEAVCTLMDCQRKIYLPILTDEEAWTLFQNKALISDATSDTLKDLGRLISDECKGLPVAIAAVACSLKGKAETEWKVALNKLRHSKPINIERGLTDPYKCLQLSYDNLDTKEAKSLFLLCSVFPEDFEIEIEILTRCAIGLGVVGEVDSYEEARSEVIAAKIKLVSCCLLLDADDECVKMHDIVRDVAHIIAKDENKIIKCEVEKDVRVEQNSVRYLWCVKFPNDLDCSNLEFLWLRTKMKEFDGIFKRMGMLKVLILENEDDEERTLSTISFKTLTNLRCLFIENYELSDFSFFGGMKNLQSLSLCNCLLSSFPELQTDVAITLKLLELKVCDIKLKNFEVMKRIPLLEELYILEIEGQWWDAYSEDNIEFFKTFSIPETLQRYGIVLGSFGFEDFDVRDIYNGRTLLLNHFDISNEVIKGLAKRAKHLFVATIHGGAKNIIPDIFQIEGGYLNELNTLKIRDSEELECLIDTRSHSSEVVTLFSKLHTLGIENMRNLRVIWHCFLPANGHFENLEKFDLSDCPRLTFLFTYVLARNFVKLKILEISGCDELKYILADDDKTEEGEDEFPTGHPVQIFQNLQDVKINRCRELKHIFPANIVGGLTQLKVVEIEECDKLDQIIGDIVPSTDRDKLIEEGTLSSLAKLKIKRCGKLGSIFTASIAKTLTSLEDLYIGGCKSLKDIVTHERVNKNHKESIVEDEPNCQSDISIFQSLKKLHISECQLLEGIFPTLQTLNIMDSDAERIFCLNEHEMIGQQVSLRLEKLKLNKLPQMTYIWVGPNNSLTLQHLTTLQIWHCGKLEVIFPKSVVRCLPELKNIIIRECMELKQIMEEDESNLLRIDGGCEVEDIIGCDKEASNNYFAFPNLKKLEIVECAKLEVVFPKSVLRCLPKLKILTIKECKELRQIIEEGVKDKKLSNLVSPQPCFPKLEALHVDDCHKLKRLFSASNDLLNLHFLVINGANELEELVGCKQGKIKVELPRLKLLIFTHLENFSQEIELHNVKNCIVYKCPKLSLTSTTTFEKLLEDFPSEDFVNTEVRRWEFEAIVRSIYDYSTINDSSEFTPSQKIEDVGNESIKSSSTGVEDIGIGGAVATHIAMVVEQDDKQEGIYVAPNNNNDISSASADIRTRLGAYKHFVDLDDAQISLLVEAITTYPHLWNASKKFSERFQAWRLNILADILLFLQKESVDSVIPQREKVFHKLCEEAIEVGFESSWVEEMRQRVVGRDPKLEEDIAQRQIDENSKRCSSGDVVEEGDGPKISLEEGSDLVDKEGEIGVVAEVFTSEILRIATSLTNSQTIETPSNSIEQVAVEETIAKNTNMATSSIFSESATSKLDPTVTLLSKSHPHHHEIGDVRNDSIKEGPAAEGAKTKSLSTGVEDIGIGGGVATHIESGGVDILAQYSKVVEQDDKMNEGKAGILPSPDCTEAVEIGFESSWVDEMRQRVVMRDPKLREDIAQRQIEENSKRCSSGNMVQDSQAVERADGPKISLEEGVASNDHIGTLRNEEAEEEFVAEVSTSEIPRIATSSQPVERSTPSCLNMPLRETPENALVDKQRIIEPSLMNQQNPFGEIRIETIAKNTNMAASSILSPPVNTQMDQKITFQNKSYPHSEITSSQTEAGTSKEIDHAKIIQDFGTNDVISLFASGKESKDSPVGKTLAELEKFLKMSLKDVVSSETDTLRLWSTLNLLSNLPFKDVTLSDGLKRIIDTMLQHFPTILRSFKQGFATTDKLGKLEACQNEVTTTLVSKISEAENFYSEAQLKEVVLKEQIKVYEAALSSLEKEKNKCIAETIGYKKELENVMKDRSQMLEDKRKVEQELFDVAYKWSNLCSEYELNLMAATNIP